jgi:two-component system, NarL family, nitrate/nitrite response regulator NarL
MLQTETMPIPRASEVPVRDPARFHADGRAYPIAVMDSPALSSAAPVVIVGGHRLVAESVANAVATDLGTTDVRCVASLRALAALDVVPGTVLVLGSTPDGSTSDAVRAARARWSRASIVILVDGSERDEVVGCIRAGADGIVPPGAGVDHFLSLVERSRRGEPLLPLPIVRRLGEQADAGRDRRPGNPGWPLSPREVEVLRHLAGGARAREIAAALGISYATAGTYVKHVIRKLGAHSSLEAVAMAMRKGIVEPPTAR